MSPPLIVDAWMGMKLQVADKITEKNPLGGKKITVNN
jgi:hypothetical protein